MYTRPPSRIQHAYHRRQKSTERDKTGERLCNYRKPARPRHVWSTPALVRESSLINGTHRRDTVANEQAMARARQLTARAQGDVHRK
jgi:hypothetical protein